MRTDTDAPISSFSIPFFFVFVVERRNSHEDSNTAALRCSKTVETHFILICIKISFFLFLLNFWAVIPKIFLLFFFGGFVLSQIFFSFHYFLCFDLRV